MESRDRIGLDKKEITRALAAAALDAVAPGHPARAMGVARLAKDLDAARPAHTPGPWKVEEQRGRVLCIVNHEDVGVAFAGTAGVPSNDANARLIAVAPDLLASAERALAYLTSDLVAGAGLDDCRICSDLRSNIRRANGGGQ